MRQQKEEVLGKVPAQMVQEHTQQEDQTQLKHPIQQEKDIEDKTMEDYKASIKKDEEAERARLSNIADMNVKAHQEWNRAKPEGVTRDGNGATSSSVLEKETPKGDEPTEDEPTGDAYTPKGVASSLLREEEASSVLEEEETPTGDEPTGDEPTGDEP